MIAPATDQDTVFAFVEEIHLAASRACEGLQDPGLLQLIRIHPADGKSVVSGRFEIGDVAEMCGAAIADSEAGHNVYIEPRTVAKGAPKRGLLEHTRAVFALVVDRDAYSGKAGVEFIDPSIRVETSPGSGHEWFMLDKAISAQEAQELGAALRVITGADSATGKPTQPYRVAGTLNYPNVKKIAMGRATCPTLFANGGPVWSVTALRDALGPIQQDVRESEPVKMSATGYISQRVEQIISQPTTPEMDRSKEACAAIRAAVEDGMTPADLEKLMRRYPEGCASKYLFPRDRLAAEIIRVWRPHSVQVKARDAFGSQRSADLLAGAANYSSLEKSNAAATSGGGGIKSAELIMRIASDIPAQQIVWLWQNRIAIGKLVLVAGDPGLGKSQFTAYLSATVSNGGHWPCGEGRATRGSAVIFSAEDDAADTIVPRLIAAGADLDRVRIVEAVTTDDGKGNKSRRMFHLQADLARLEAALLEIGDVRLVIIDPITAYLGGVDTHRNSDVRGVLGLVAEMAARHQVAVVAISHWNKTNVGTAVNRVTGSGAFTAAVRAAFMVAKDPDDHERRLFVPMKNNLARTDSGLAFRIEQHLIGQTKDIVTSAIVWEDERITRTADEILAASNNDAGSPLSAAEEAADWLHSLLYDGPMAAKEVQSQAEDAGLSWATVRRAKGRLGIKPERQSEGGDGSGKWVWSLPFQGLQGAQKTQDAHDINMGTLQEFEHLGSGEGDK